MLLCVRGGARVKVIPLPIIKLQFKNNTEFCHIFGRLAWTFFMIKDRGALWPPSCPRCPPPPTSTFLPPSAALNPAGIPPSAVICLRASEATVRWGWWARRVLTLDAISWGVHPRHPRWPVRHNAVTTNKRFTSLGYFPFNLWHNRDSIIASSVYIYTHHRLKKRRLQPATRGEWQ